METAEIAREALKILDRDGWCKGSRNYPPLNLGNPSFKAGSHCIGGAWEAVTGEQMCMQNTDHYLPLIEVIREQYPEVDDLVKEEGVFIDLPVRVITLFNDLDSTTEASVRAILEKLAVGG